jgi:thiosulfate dehydrogenase
MTRKTILALLAVSALAAAGAVLAGSNDGPPRHDSPPSKSGDVVVALCDGETTAEIPGVKEGETPTRDQAQAVVDQLMSDWRKKNPNARWEDGPVQVAQAVEPQGKAPAVAGQGKAGGLPSGPQEAVQSGHTYGAFSDRDERIWKEETDRFVQEGHRVFHDAKAVGGTIAVSCDMCHPDGANTHPETYPKFQVQLGRVALLRDMINWCIQNPARGKPLPDDDARLKAMEAYILAQRRGVPIDPGKH